MTRFLLCFTLPLLVLLAACGGTDTTADDAIAEAENEAVTSTPVVVEDTTDDSLDPTETSADEPATPQPEPTSAPSSPDPTPESEPGPSVDLEAMLLTRDFLGDGWMQAVTEESEGTEDDNFLCGYEDIETVGEADVAYGGEGAYVKHAVYQVDEIELTAFMNGLPQAIADCERWEDDDGMIWTVGTMTLPVLGDASAGFLLRGHDPAEDEGFTAGVLSTRYGNILSLILYSHWYEDTISYGTYDMAKSVDFIVSMELDQEPFMPAVGDTVRLTNGASVTVHEVSIQPTPAEMMSAAPVHAVIDAEVCAGEQAYQPPYLWDFTVHPVEPVDTYMADAWGETPYQEDELAPGACVRGEVGIAMDAETMLSSINVEIPKPGIGAGLMVNWWLEQEPLS
jgi:hypothetical protein